MSTFNSENKIGSIELNPEIIVHVKKTFHDVANNETSKEEHSNKRVSSLSYKKRTESKNNSSLLSSRKRIAPSVKNSGCRALSIENQQFELFDNSTSLDTAQLRENSCSYECTFVGDMKLCIKKINRTLKHATEKAKQDKEHAPERAIAVFDNRELYSGLDRPGPAFSQQENAVEDRCHESRPKELKIFLKALREEVGRMAHSLKSYEYLQMIQIDVSRDNPQGQIRNSLVHKRAVNLGGLIRKPPDDMTSPNYITLLGSLDKRYKNGEIRTRFIIPKTFHGITQYSVNCRNPPDCISKYDDVSITVEFMMKVFHRRFSCEGKFYTRRLVSFNINSKSNEASFFRTVFVVRNHLNNDIVFGAFKSLPGLLTWAGFPLESALGQDILAKAATSSRRIQRPKIIPKRVKYDHENNRHLSRKHKKSKIKIQSENGSKNYSRTSPIININALHGYTCDVMDTVFDQTNKDQNKIEHKQVIVTDAESGLTYTVMNHVSPV